MNSVKTDPNLRPRLRFLNILNSNLQNENFRLVKSSNAFKRELDFGQQAIRLSFINTMGIIHGVQTVHTIKFTQFEKIFRKIFKDYSCNWTCIYRIYGNETYLCDKETFEYSDDSLNKAAKEFFNSIKPQIDNKINSNYLENLYLELSDFSIPFYHHIGIEKRVLLLIWFAVKRNSPQIFELKNKSLELFKKSKEMYKPELKNILKVIELIESENKK